MEIRVEIKEIIIVFTVPDVEANAEESTPVQVQCSDCGWTKSYPNERVAKRGLAAHQSHCPGPHEEVERLRRMMGMPGDEG